MWLSWLLLGKTKDFQSSSMSLDLCEKVSISAFIDPRCCWFKSLRTVWNSGISNQNNRFELDRVGTSTSAVRSLTMALNLHASLTFPRANMGSMEPYGKSVGHPVILSNFLVWLVVPKPSFNCKLWTNGNGKQLTTMLRLQTPSSLRL